MADIKEEFRLARQMKEACCDNSGKETDPVKAAEIIHKIGLIYRKRSPDKISLIKSVGLFNAAIVRNPSNVAKVKSDLSETCRHVLQLAQARNQTADLVKKAKHVKTAIIELRNKVKCFLEISIPKLSAKLGTKSFRNQVSNKVAAIQKLNKAIAKKYKHIMADLSQYCEDVMGKPPCEYAIAGMASLAREEITPYSDFEHVILLFDDKKYKSNLEYFKSFSVIFHVIILNIQETIIPSLNICSLNGKEDWYYDAITPRGISFDGMMPHGCKFPLGRLQYTANKQFTTELIKPVSKMLEYLTSEADLKNGYHLADILTKTCFVFGNKDIFKQFVDGVQNYRDKKSKLDIINDVQQQVKDDLNSFSTRFRLTKLQSYKTINVKQLVYRSTTIFIAVLARIHNISANPCFDVVDEMANDKKITESTAHKLRCAIAIACEMRLRVYMKKQCQCDNAIDLKHNGTKQFLDIVGLPSTINYFQIAYCLQREIAKQLHFTKLHFYSDPQLINITIGLAFGIKDLVYFPRNPLKRVWESNVFEFDDCIKHLEKEVHFNFKVFQRIIVNIFSFICKTQAKQQIKEIADYLYSVEVYDEALDFYKQLLEFYQVHHSRNGNPTNDIAYVNHQIGFCLVKLKRPTYGLKYLNQALESEQTTIRNAKIDSRIAITLHNIGYCLLDLNNYKVALSYMKQALKIKQIRGFDSKTEMMEVAKTHHTIGYCHIFLHNYDNANKYLNRALKIKQYATFNAKTDTSIATTLHTIGYLYINLHNYDDALQILHKALEIKQNATNNADKDRVVAITLYNIGCCHSGLLNYNEALIYLTRVHEIQYATSLDLDTDFELAITQCSIGSCLTGLQRYDEAWKCLEKSQKILKNTGLKENKGCIFANLFNNMGECSIKTKHFSKALTHLQRALKIYQNSTTHSLKDTKLARTFYNIGVCLIEMQEYADALVHFEKSLKIYEHFPLNGCIRKIIALIRSDIEVCLVKLG